jgi:flagellar hook protein FlgE
MNMNVSINAIHHAVERVNRAAVRISAGAANDNLARDMVNLMVAEKEVRLAVKTVRAQDEMLGSLLDIKA